MLVYLYVLHISINGEIIRAIKQPSELLLKKKKLMPSGVKNKSPNARGLDPLKGYLLKGYRRVSIARWIGFSLH